MHEPGFSAPGDEVEVTLTNVANLPLMDLLRSDDSALSNALKRLLRDMDRPGENYAEHGTTP